jgi:hypothetical protein
MNNADCLDTSSEAVIYEKMKRLTEELTVAMQQHSDDVIHLIDAIHDCAVEMKKVSKS